MSWQGEELSSKSIVILNGRAVILTLNEVKWKDLLFTSITHSLSIWNFPHRPA
jgi:hypothetical protein